MQDDVCRRGSDGFWGAAVLRQALEDADADTLGKAGRSRENITEDIGMASCIELPKRDFFGVLFFDRLGSG